MFVHLYLGLRLFPKDRQLLLNYFPIFHAPKQIPSQLKDHWISMRLWMEWEHVLDSWQFYQRKGSSIGVKRVQFYFYVGNYFKIRDIPSQTSSHFKPITSYCLTFTQKIMALMEHLKLGHLTWPGQVWLCSTSPPMPKLLDLYKAYKCGFKSRPFQNLFWASTNYIMFMKYTHEKIVMIVC